MNVFYEFHKIVQKLQAENVPYALIGGVAVSIHTTPRFTKDVDILISRDALARVTEILKSEGYFASATPWTWSESQPVLHRYLKIQEQDEMIIDVFVAGNVFHEDIIRNACEAESKGTGTIRVATRQDLIRLKKLRNSKQDQADIERLENEERRPGV